MPIVNIDEQFAAAKAAQVEAGHEPVAFILGGQRFDCVPKPTLGDGLTLAEIGTPKSQADAVRLCADLIERLVVPLQRPAFWALLKDPAAAIEDVHLFAVVTELVEAYTARPTKGPSRSSRRRPSNGSKRKSSAGATDKANS